MNRIFTLVVLFLVTTGPLPAQSLEEDVKKVLKGKEPLTLRWIKAKTESWSPLAEGQIIAQKTIKPIIAHAGYEPHSNKFAVIWTNNQRYTGTFEIIDLRSNNQPPKEPIVFTGKLKEYGFHIWGGNNLIADFSDFKTPGFYKIRLKLDQTKETTDSWGFEIKENLYFELAQKASEWFQYQKCGAAVPGWYEACHLDDAAIHDTVTKRKVKALTGGWHDAGDYNKWPIYTPPPLYALGMFHEAFKNKAKPELSSYLTDELAWELSFLCKAQKEDGTFYSIISSVEKPWIWAGVPELEEQRIAVNHNVGNGDPRDLSHCIRIAAAVLKAATVIQDKYPLLKDSCLKLAEKPYAKALKIKYNSKVAEKESKTYLSIQTGMLGADVAFFQLTNDPKYKKDAELRVKNLISMQSAEGYFFNDYHKKSVASWADIHLVSLYEFYQAFPSSPLINEIAQVFKKYADFYKSYYKKSPFGNTGDFQGLENYSMITNNKSAGLNAWAFAFAYQLFKDKEYREMSINNLNWILGFNPADVSMMAGIGAGPGAYHHRYTSIPGHGDGIVPGGVLNGIKAGTGEILFLGDEGAENFVLGYYLPKDYPTIDTDVEGWTYAWWPNEYHIPNNAYFIMAAYMLALTIE